MQIRCNLCTSSCSRTAPSSRAAGRRAGRRRRRGLLHDRDDRLRGGRHRPELRRAGALLRLPADRDLRRRRGADGVRPRAVRGRRHARRRAPSSRRGSATAASSRSTGVDTRTLVRKIRDGGVLRCALGDAPVEELHARALAEPPIDGRPLDRHVGTREPYTVGVGPARRRRRPRLEALDPAPARRHRARGARRPRLVGRRRDPRRASRGPCSSRTAPATRPCSSARSTRSATCSAACRSSASASATSSSGSRSATRRSSSRSATAARTIPVRDLAHGPRARHRPEPRLRGARRTATSRTCR